MDVLSEQGHVSARQFDQVSIASERYCVGKSHINDVNSDKKLLDLIANHAADLIAVIDPEGRRVWNDRAYFAVLGYTPEEIHGTDSFLEIHPDDLPLVRATFARSMRTGEGQRIEYRMKHRDGHWVYLESEARIVYDWNGHQKCLLLIARDITARREAEAALARVQKRLLQELQEAADYVRSILPGPLIEGAITCEWRFAPSAELGGDAFGYHWIDDDHFSFYIIDAAGHGVRAALLSVSAVNTLRSQSLRRCDFRNPAAVLGAMNRNYQMDQHGELFFTLWFGVFCRSTRELRFASAGHPPPLFFPPGASEATPLKSQGLMIGAMPEASYETRTAILPAGTMLYMFSDGAFELCDQNEKAWSSRDLAELLASHRKLNQVELDLIIHDLREANGGADFEDDFSLLRFVFS